MEAGIPQGVEKHKAACVRARLGAHGYTHTSGGNAG